MRVLHLTLVTLKGQCQSHSDFESLYLVKEFLSRKGSELGHILLIKYYYQTIYGQFNDLEFEFDLE